MKLNSPHPTRRHMRGWAAPWILGAFAAIALFFLLTEHRAHLYGAWPYLLLVAFVALHLFGHGSHGGHGGHAGHGGPAPDGVTPSPPAKGQTPVPSATPPTTPATHHHH